MQNFQVRIDGCQTPSNMAAPSPGKHMIVLYEIDPIEWLFRIRQVC